MVERVRISMGGMWDRARQARLRLPAVIPIVALLLVLPALLPGNGMYYGTFSMQFVPWRWFGVQALLSGELPLWNPLSGMGAPLVANYQSAFFYPEKPTSIVSPY